MGMWILTVIFIGYHDNSSTIQQEHLSEDKCRKAAEVFLKNPPPSRTVGGDFTVRAWCVPK